MEEDQESEQRWATYSDFQDQAARVADIIYKANDAYSFIMSVSSQGVALREQDAVDAKRAMLRAGNRLMPEIRQNEGIEPFDEIHERWSGEEGILRMLQVHDLYDGAPEWLRKYNEDMMTVGWEIGYLKAGRQEPADPEAEDVKVQEVID